MTSGRRREVGILYGFHGKFPAGIGVLIEDASAGIRSGAADMTSVRCYNVKIEIIERIPHQCYGKVACADIILDDEIVHCGLGKFYPGDSRCLSASVFEFDDKIFCSRNIDIAFILFDFIADLNDYDIMRAHLLGPVTEVSYEDLICALYGFREIDILYRRIRQIVRMRVHIDIERSAVRARICIVDPVVIRSYHMKIKVIVRTPDHGYRYLTGTRLQEFSLFCKCPCRYGDFSLIDLDTLAFYGLPCPYDIGRSACRDPLYDRPSDRIGFDVINGLDNGRRYDALVVFVGSRYLESADTVDYVPCRKARAVERHIDFFRRCSMSRH